MHVPVGDATYQPLETRGDFTYGGRPSGLVVLEDAGHGTRGFGTEMVAAIDSMPKD